VGQTASFEDAFNWICDAHSGSCCPRPNSLPTALHTRGVMVTPPSLPANIHDASHQGQDGLLPADASEAGAGAFAMALGVTSVAAGYSDPKTCEDGLYCHVASTVGGGIGGHARSEG
jgi:hypothetical protein